MSDDKDKIIESLRAELDLAHKFHDVAVAERDYERRLKNLLGEVLAVLNGDGGQTTRELGWEESTKRALARYYAEKKMKKEEIINWLTSRADEINRSPDPLIMETLNTLVGESRAIAAAWAGVVCKPCGGFGERTYGSTSTWRGGIGGQSMTVGVCDKCWGTGRTDTSGPNLLQMQPKPSTSADPMLCSWCGHPKNSTTCQRSHP